MNSKWVRVNVYRSQSKESATKHDASVLKEKDVNSTSKLYISQLFKCKNVIRKTVTSSDYCHVIRKSHSDHTRNTNRAIFLLPVRHRI